MLHVSPIVKHSQAVTQSGMLGEQMGRLILQARQSQQMSWNSSNACATPTSSQSCML